MVGKNISHYKILEKLGQGGMGVVYKARDTNLDRDVALKFLPHGSTPDEKDKHRFRQEARAAARLSHPNICGIHSINEHEGQQFIEMEYVEGKTLRQVMNEAETLSLNKVRNYAVGIAEALSAAHREHIIHRDIKPENIMVDKNDRIKVMDFGLAKLKGARHITKSGSTVGTVTYMSPEQMQSVELDPRSDIFSFGVILYEMLSGNHPFQAEYEQALMFKILNEDPEPPSSIRDDIPADLEQIVVKCLQKDREKRYDSAVDLLHDLQGKSKEKAQRTTAAATGSIPATGTTGKKPISQNYLSWTLPAVLLFLLLAFVWYYPTTLGFESEERLPEYKHIVVLPFKNLSPQDIPQSIIDGTMEILSSKITQMGTYQGSLWVVPSTEVRADNTTSIKEASNRYGEVNLAVTGSMQHVGNKLLLTINLTDVNTMRQFSSSILEMDWANHTDLLDSVVRTLTEMLDITLENSTFQTLAATGTQSSSLYQLYIEGTGYLSRFEDEESLDKAIQIFRQAVDADTGYVRARAALAEAHWRKYELTSNTEYAKVAQKIGTETIARMGDRVIPEAYITMAMIYNGRGQNKKALDMLDELEEPENHSYQALTEKAEANKQMGNVEQAEKLYKEAIEKKDKYWAGYNNLGVFYHEQGRLKEAAEEFRKVTELAPYNIRGYTNLGGTYIGMGMFGEAINIFRKSLEIHPDHDTYTNLGTLYYYQKNYKEAITMYEKAIELRKTDFRSYGALGQAYYWSGADSSKFKKYILKAIEQVEQGLEVTPDDPDKISQLAGYHVILGNDKKCRELLKQLTALQDPPEDIRISIIHLYEQLGDREAALKWAERSLENDYSLEMLKSLEGTEGLLNDTRMAKLLEKKR